MVSAGRICNVQAHPSQQKQKKRKKVYLALVVFLTQTETQMDWGFKWPVGEFHVLTFPEAAPVLGGDLPLDVTKRIGK